MEQLKHMKENLTSLVQSQLSNIDRVDYKELGGAIDMIKDLAETIYYCSITEAMEKSEDKKEEYSRDYPMVYNRYYRDMDRTDGRMYYDGGTREYSDGNATSSGTNQGVTTAGGAARYYPNDYAVEMRDIREGRSPSSRKMYMESKELHHPTEKKMKELEQYMHELSQDVTEMIEDATPEEKQLLHKKISALATKINQL